MSLYAISDLHLSFDEDKPMDIFGKNWKNKEGITMESYKQEFIEFMVESNVLRFGDFITKSGRKTPFR